MCQGTFSCQKQKHTQPTSRKGRCGGEVVSKRFTGLGTKIRTEKPLGAQSASQSPSFSSSHGRCDLVPLSELPLHLPLPANRPASSAHSGLRPLNVGSYLARRTSPAPLFPSCLLASTLLTSCRIPWAHLISNTRVGL